MSLIEDGMASFTPSFSAVFFHVKLDFLTCPYATPPHKSAMTFLSLLYYHMPINKLQTQPERKKKHTQLALGLYKYFQIFSPTLYK